MHPPPLTMIPTDDYLQHDGLALGAKVARRELTALALVDTALAQTALLNPIVNAIDTINAERARERASRLDAELGDMPDDDARVALLRSRPFLGVPMPLKDLSTACVDLPSSMGSKFFRKIAWDHDSELVLRYRQAGFIPFARSTSPELGLNPSTEADVYGGPTRNPWNLAHSSGGSSGGAAVSVAAGIVPLAHATDGLGSIRIPASCCNLVGLKPTRGLVPMGPAVGEAWGGLAAEHVVSRTVRDSAAVLDLTAGADTGAPYAAPVIPAGGFLRAVEAAARGELPRLRIAILDRAFDGEAIHPEVAAVVNAAGTLLQGLGHSVEPDAPQFASRELLLAALEIVACGTALAVETHSKELGRAPREDELAPTIRGAIAFARGTSGARYLQQLAILHRETRRIASFWDRYDVLLLPTLAEPPAVLGRFAVQNPDYLDYRAGPNGTGRYSPFAPMANVTGQPAISVPAGLSAAGLPIGVQMVGRFGDDATLLALAAQIELQRPWAALRPPLR